MLVSEFLEIDNELDDLGTFDARIDKDSHFFINIVRLKHSSTPEFANAYELINSRFSDIATLLSNAESPTRSDKFFRSARQLFDFSEVNGINLGFSKSTSGSGFGDQLSTIVLQDAYQIVNASLSYWGTLASLFINQTPRGSIPILPLFLARQSKHRFLAEPMLN